MIKKILTEGDRGGIASLVALIPGNDGAVSGEPLNLNRFLSSMT